MGCRPPGIWRRPARSRWCVDKAGVGAGASGIACGVIRNNYFQPAMQELMAACVEIWESDPETLHYHGSGYVALGPPSQEPDLAEVFERQQRIGYPSELFTGEATVRAHMRELYPDWRAEGLTVCLHERRGGFAFNRESMLGLAAKAAAARARGSPRGSRSPASPRRLGRRDRGRDERRHDRGRAGRGRGGPVDPASVAAARAARLDRGPRRRTARSSPRCRCGPTGTCRRARSRWRRRPSTPPTGTEGPVLHVDSDARCTTTRAPGHRRAPGAST